MVNEQFPSLVPTLYLGSMATDPRRLVSLDAMWKAHNKTLAVNGETRFSLPASSTGARSSTSSEPWSAGHGRGQDQVSVPVAFVSDGIEP